MKTERMVDHYYGLIMEVEQVSNTGDAKRKNMYFLRVIDRATEEIIEEGTSFTNKAELQEYYNENYREGKDEVC